MSHLLRRDRPFLPSARRGGTPMAPSAASQLPPGSHIERGHMHGRHLAQIQELCQPFSIFAIVLVLGSVDQPQLAGMGHQDPRRQSRSRSSATAASLSPPARMSDPPSALTEILTGSAALHTTSECKKRSYGRGSPVQPAPTIFSAGSSRETHRSASASRSNSSHVPDSSRWHGGLNLISITKPSTTEVAD
jgi:hypothetical protein